MEKEGSKLKEAFADTTHEERYNSFALVSFCLLHTLV